MYKHLRLTALIMLIALMFTPILVLASPFQCNRCGGEPHMDPAACVKYAHASDCPCSECAEKKDTSLIDVLTDLSNLMPGTQQLRTGMNYLAERWDDLNREASSWWNSEYGIY